MLAAGCGDRCPTAVADHDAGPGVIVVASVDTMTVTDTVAATIATTVADTVATAVTIPVTATVPTTGSSTATCPAAAAPTSTAAATMREHRGCRQGSHQQSEHEHSESCHVAPPP
jgi:hypothetical protein